MIDLDDPAIVWGSALAELGEGRVAGLLALLQEAGCPKAYLSEFQALLLRGAPVPVVRRGQKPRVPEAVCRRVRDLWTVRTNPRGDTGFGWSKKRAGAEIAAALHVSEGTVRNIVERRGAYASKRPPAKK